MTIKRFFLLISGLLIVSADLAFLHSRGGGGGGGGHMGGGGFGGGHMGGGFGGGHSFGGAHAGGGMAHTASRPASSSSRPASGGHSQTGNRTNGNANRSGYGHNSYGRGGYGHGGYGYGHGGYGYYGGAFGGWGWGAFGLGLYLPLTLALSYGIANNGGSGDSTVINNYNTTSPDTYGNSDTYPATDQENIPQGEYVPRVPADAVFITPEMMNDPNVQRALEAMKQQQNPQQRNQASLGTKNYGISTRAALEKSRLAQEED